MSDISNIAEEYNRIVAEMEENINDQESLEFAKVKLSEMFMLVLEKTDKLVEEYEKKLEYVANNQKDMSSKIVIMEKILKSIEKDIYDDSSYDFEIICPYCNHEFVTEFGDTNMEIQCPECKNVIELDWNSAISGGCEEHCNGGCCGHHHDDETDEEDEDL